MDAILSYKLNPDDDLYAIIGCDELSTPEQILTEYRIKAVECHPDKNFGNSATLEKFQKLQRAKDILTDEVQRKDYDLWKRSGLAIPFDDWMARKSSMKMSMHWVTRMKKEPAIEAPPDMPAKTVPEDSHDSPGQFAGSEINGPTSNFQSHEPTVYWTSTGGSEALRKFRNYEI